MLCEGAQYQAHEEEDRRRNDTTHVGNTWIAPPGVQDQDSQRTSANFISPESAGLFVGSPPTGCPVRPASRDPIESEGLVAAGSGKTSDTTDSSSATISTQKRDVPAHVKKEIYKENGIPKSERKNYVIDHKVPLELGGSNSKANLQPQTKADAKTKDKWENYLTGQVKSGKMTLEQAQVEIQAPHTAPPPKKK